MKENTRLLVLAGVHGKEGGELGVKGKDNFVEDSERRLTKKFKDDIEGKKIQFAVIDVGSEGTGLT